MTVVGAIILNSRGEFLLQQRDDDAPTYKNCWTLFGGIATPHESPRQALLRELYEELHLLSRNIISVQRVQKNMQDSNVCQIIYKVRIEATISQLTLTEGRAMSFIAADKLFDRRFAFNIKAVLSRYLAVESD